MPISADDKLRFARYGALQNAIVIRVVRNRIQFKIRLDYVCAVFEFCSNRQRIAFGNSEFAAQFLVQFIQKRA